MHFTSYKKFLLRTSSLASHHFNMRRAADISIVIAFAIPVSVAILFIASAVYATTRSRPFFRQERIGLNNKPFTLYKIRSMTDVLDKSGAPIADKKRLTKLGQIIRRYGFDELPQLYNILKGDMSLLGPRPLLANEMIDLPRWNDRHAVRPGLTGPAQIREKQWGVAPDPQLRLEDDLSYIGKRNFAGDVALIWKTAQLVLCGRVDTSNRAQAMQRRNISSRHNFD